MRSLLTLVLLFAASPGCFAAGGTCPTGATYMNPANPTGALVTLSSLGITSCYFIAANGADTNDGLSEANGHPFAHAPGMANCVSSCAAISFAQGTQLAGIGFIFRGGDTWHFGQNTGDYTGGVWEWNPASGGPSGTAAHPVYLGVDSTWFSGGSWARPIFTADNPLCNTNTANGTTCISATDTFGQNIFYTSSCSFQVAANGGNANDFFDFGNQNYIIVDNFEMTGLCQSGAGDLNHKDTYISYASMTGPMYFLNNYIHGASHIKYVAPNGSTGCSPVGVVVCINLTAFNGSSNNGVVGETVAFNVVDFSDSDPAGENLTLAGFYNVAYNAFRYTTQGLPNTLRVFHDNLYEFFFENGHSNMIESKEVSTAAIYNNVFRHIETSLSSGGGVGLWPGPQSGVTTYVFNNLMYDVGGLGEPFNMGGTGLTTNPGNYTVFNNTFQMNLNAGLWGCTNSPVGTILLTNNHVIDNQTPSSCGTLLTGLLMSNATATADGYTSSQTFAYSPIAGNSPTVGTGTNKQSYCTTLLGSADALIQAAGTACQSDTTYACTYNTGNHTMTCPARPVVLQPASGAWNIGAYQFGIIAPAPATVMF